MLQSPGMLPIILHILQAKHSSSRSGEAKKEPPVATSRPFRMPRLEITALTLVTTQGQPGCIGPQVHLALSPVSDQDDGGAVYLSLIHAYLS